MENKYINQITFYFVEEGPGCGSEDIKKEFNVNCGNKMPTRCNR